MIRILLNLGGVCFAAAISVILTGPGFLLTRLFLAAILAATEAGN